MTIADGRMPFARYAILRRPPRDVKNEDRPDYVYENKGHDDKMSGELHDIYQENA